jgi:oxygen-independent coproporphyrinogen-3 oxidase
VEEGTRLAAHIRRGELLPPDDDDLADKYLIADERLGAAGYTAYEVSNWATSSATRCRHNLGYWRSDHWWGIGPGAHSHIGGVRWWNVKHPRAYASRLAEGLSPAYAREVLTPEERRWSASCWSSASPMGLPHPCLPAPNEVVLPIFAIAA